MNETTNELLTTIMQVVIIPLIPILAGYLVKLLKAKADQTATKINNERMRQYMQDATDAVLQAVTATTQTYVDALKQEGSFDAESQMVAFEKSRDLALRLLSVEARQMITDVYGDITTWLDTKIEQTVKDQNHLP
jgi:hypothetical protein